MSWTMAGGPVPAVRIAAGPAGVGPGSLALRAGGAGRCPTPPGHLALPSVAVAAAPTHRASRTKPSPPPPPPPSIEERFRLHNLSPQPGANGKKRRVGRGHGAGQGGSSGRGMKGQRARSGGGIPHGFEGGQMPLHRRVPKLRGSTGRQPKASVRYAPVNLGKLAEKLDRFGERLGWARDADGRWWVGGEGQGEGELDRGGQGSSGGALGGRGSLDEGSVGLEGTLDLEVGLGALSLAGGVGAGLPPRPTPAPLVVDRSVLSLLHLIPRSGKASNLPIKILGVGDGDERGAARPPSVEVRADAFSVSARQGLQAAGGSAVIHPPPRPKWTRALGEKLKEAVRSVDRQFEWGRAVSGLERGEGLGGEEAATVSWAGEQSDGEEGAR